MSECWRRCSRSIRQSIPRRPRTPHIIPFMVPGKGNPVHFFRLNFFFSRRMPLLVPVMASCLLDALLEAVLSGNPCSSCIASQSVPCLRIRHFQRHQGWIKASSAAVVEHQGQAEGVGSCSHRSTRPGFAHIYGQSRNLRLRIRVFSKKCSIPGVH